MLLRNVVVNFEIKFKPALFATQVQFGVPILNILALCVVCVHNNDSTYFTRAPNIR